MSDFTPETRGQDQANEDIRGVPPADQVNDPGIDPQARPLDSDVARSSREAAKSTAGERSDAGAGDSGSVADETGWYSESAGDEVEDASMDSFPASDPPSYYPSAATHPQ